MPRTAREVSATGIYHVMVRGIDKRDIFLKVGDCRKFLSLVEKAREKSDFQLLGYCLMPNHVHLLLRTEEDPVGDVMKRITVGYAQYHNLVHNRFGHLFQNRFRSETVEDDTYFKTVLRYIHQNPVKAKMVDHPMAYRWSSFFEYMNPAHAKLTDVAFGLSLFTSSDQFIRFMETPSEDVCLDLEAHSRISDEDVIRHGKDLMQEKEATWENLSKGERLETVLKLREETGASHRQMARALGVHRCVIDRLMDKPSHGDVSRGSKKHT